MALRAGYYGVKRRIWEALQSTVAKSVQDITDIWNNNAITGAHNLFSVPTKYSVKSGSSVSYSDGVYTITTDTTNDAGMYFSAGATLRPSLAAFVGVKGKLSFEYKAEAAFNGVVGFDTAIKYSTSFVKYEADIADLSQISAIVFYDRDTTSGHTITVKNMMIKLADDPVDDVTPFAMTNRQLTKAYNITYKTGVTFDSTYCDTTDSNYNLSVKGNIAQFLGLAKITTQVPQYTKFIEGLPGLAVSGFAYNFAILSSADGTKTYRCYLDAAGKIYAHVTPIPVGSYAISFVYFCAEDSGVYTRSLDAAPEERSLDVEEPVVVKKSTRKKTTKTEEEE